jgi:hypothetical protein
MWRKSAAQETKYWLFRVSPQTNAPKFTFSTVATSLWEELSRDSKGSRIRDKWRVLIEAVLIVSWDVAEEACSMFLREYSYRRQRRRQVGSNFNFLYKHNFLCSPQSLYHLRNAFLLV